jgi:predicted aspartyl protease
MEDIPEGEQVFTGMFFLNGHPIAILFDSGAIIDFISKACTQRFQLVIQNIDTPYMISTLEGKIVTRQMVMHTPLNLAGRIYKPSLIVLDGQGLDIILGMS